MQNKVTFLVSDYDLAATLTSGQVFRWQNESAGWTGIIGSRWVRLRSDELSLTAETVEAQTDWGWLVDHLQLQTDLNQVLASFPTDEPMQTAVLACRGLRLLRQDPWECLASFILSSTKQIVQIQRIIALLCQGFGEPLQGPEFHSPAYRFPTAQRLAETTEAELRACKMGFRAPYLLATAQAIAGRKLELSRIAELPVEQARAELLTLPGVGPKIADCVLLFAYGFQSAFPLDVWVLKALRQLYFPRRRVTLNRLRHFAATHFGPNAGYAQQYLFHYMRTKRAGRPSGEKTAAAKYGGTARVSLQSI